VNKDDYYYYYHLAYELPKCRKGDCFYSSVENLLIQKSQSLHILRTIVGTILNVEGAMMKTFEMFSEVDVDPDVTVYTSQHKFKRLAQILRVFYLLGPPFGEEICKYTAFPLYFCSLLCMCNCYWYTFINRHALFHMHM
jgi:hypothetical protein